MIVVDDPIYNISNKFDEIDIFYAQGNPNETLIDFQFENRESLIKKFKFGELYWDFFNNTYTNFFDEIEDELVLIVKRNSIDKLNLKNLNLENIEYNYNYALSGWFFIRAQSPEYGASYNTYTPILDYNGKPTILYNY